MRGSSRRGYLKVGWIAELLLWLGGCPLLAQAVPDASVTAALRSLNARAGVVFVGQVVSVRALGGLVEVEFAVQQTVKGEVGSAYVLREWGGLWAGAQRRYWVGERVLVFLHEPGPKGLSSPVDGMEGVLPVAVAAGPDALAVDVQRLRARVVRQAGTPMGDGEGRVAVRALVSLLRVRAPRRPVSRPPGPVREPLDLELPARLLPEVEVVEGHDDAIR